MLDFEDVCYAYDGVPILRHVDFRIPQGQAVALLGPNGAGKSTLLRMLNGLIFPEIGCYRFQGTEITARSMREHRYSKWFHQRVGFVFQDPSVQLFSASVREELAFGPEQMGLSDAEIQRRTEDAMRLFQLGKLADRTPYTLSGGEKKRTAIASVFTMNPSVWTLDEPLAALDEKTADFVLDFLLSLKQAGKTLIFSTHDRHMADRLADARLVFCDDHTIRYET